MRSGKYDSSLTARIQGGLGNQMFQYAAASTLARRLGLALKLDLSWYHSVVREPNVTPRTFELPSFFDAPEALAQSRLTATCPPRARRQLEWIERRLRGVADITEANYFQDADINAGYLRGDFQDERFFVSESAIVRASFTQLAQASPEFLGLRSQFQRQPSVAVHVRRGDYVTDARTNAFHGVCSSEYYVAGVERLKQELGDFVCWVFSDDPAWAKVNLKLPAETYVVPSSATRSAAEDLVLMSSCEHFVIANSSFSWWAAWLSDAEDKKVIAPGRWFVDPKRNALHALPSAWIRI